MRAAAPVAAIALAAGAAIGPRLADTPSASALAYGLTASGLVSAVFGLRARATAAVLCGAALGFAGGGCLLGASAWREAWRPSLRVLFERTARADEALTAVLTGVLDADAAPGPQGVVLRVRAVGIRLRQRTLPRASVWLDDAAERAVHGGVLVSVGGGLAEEAATRWRAGRVVRMSVRLRRPAVHVNPGGADEAGALARRGVTLVGSVKSAALVEVVAPGGRASEWAAAVRAGIRRLVARHVGRWNATSAAIVSAILIGDRTRVDADVLRVMRDAGTYHVMAISGGNIAILAAATLALFRWSGWFGRTATMSVMAGLVAYALVVDGGASVDRAVTMAVLFLGARALDLHVPGVRGLTVAAGVLVAADPLAVSDPGFLLSCGATLGILAVAPVLDRCPGRRAGRAAAGLLLASIAAEVALLPLVAVLFGRVTLAGLLLNLVAVPAMAVVQFAGLVLVPAALVSGTAASAVGAVASWAAVALVDSARMAEWLPALIWHVDRPSAAAVMAYYAAVGGAWIVWQWPVGSRGTEQARPYFRALRDGTLRRVVTALACAAAIWIGWEPWARVTERASGRLALTFLDVGQGDATVVRFPRGSTMLVDAGGSPSLAFDVGDRIVIPALLHLGIRRLDTVVVTHGDADHAGGVPAAIRALRPFDVWEGIPVPSSDLLRALRTAARSAGARWANVQRDDRIAIDGVDLVVHHPARADWERPNARNDDSVVIELRWGDVSIVLAGDIGPEVEAAIADRFAPARLRVLKAAHHGSASSSTGHFLDRVRPVAAVISAGVGNAFGHPAPAVLDRAAAVGAAVYRTDRDGAITVTTDGARLRIESMTGRHREWR